MAEKNGRTSYLLDGRRVTVRDLLADGLLQPGAQLTFDRPRSGERHEATVAADGSLETGGRVYRSPSAAAAATTESGQYDGWTAWTTASGTSLHRLRAELLKRLAAATRIADTSERVEGWAEDVGMDAVNSTESLLPRHHFLARASKAAESGQAASMTVREFLGYWGARTRGSRVLETIEADLDNYGLTTEPEFQSVTLDDEITVVPRGSTEDAEASGALISHSLETGAQEELVGADSKGNAGQTRSRSTAMTLGNLTEVWGNLVSVKTSATLAEATTKMLINDFSQVPVLKNDYSLAGAVTWKSVAQAGLRCASPTLADATVPAKKRPYNADLNEVLPVLEIEEFVVVTDHHRKISGLVTVADIVGLYERRTLPFILVGELDLELRRLIDRFDPEEIRRLLGSGDQDQVVSTEAMTMGSYERILQNPGCWATLNWPVDRKVFISRLAELRAIRNDIMHFNRDALPAGALAKLRGMLGLIRQLDPEEDGL